MTRLAWDDFLFSKVGFNIFIDFLHPKRKGFRHLFSISLYVQRM